MRPTPIPDHEIWDGATRKVFTAPDGDLTNPNIAPVEALVDRSPSTGHPTVSVRCELEDGDLLKLAAGGTVWLTFWGGVIPFATTVVEHQALVHGIDRGTQEHLCGAPSGVGTDAREPAMAITCRGCREALA